MKKRSLSRSPYALLAALIFFVMGIYAAVRVFIGADYAGYDHDHLIDGLLAAVWLSSAFAALIAQRPALYVVVLGLFATFAHAWLGAVVIGWAALPYFVATFALIFLLRRSFGLFNPTDTEHARHRPLPRMGA